LKNDKRFLCAMEIIPPKAGKVSFPKMGEIHIWKAFSSNKKDGSNCRRYGDGKQVSSRGGSGVVSPGRATAARIAALYFEADVSDIVLGVNEGGKPCLECNGRLHFNLSHCGGHLAVAFASEAVGFDMERKGRKADFLVLSRRFFSPDEAIEIEKHGGDLFLEWWTAKEAILKMDGSGLQGGLARVGVDSPGWGRLGGEKVGLRRLDWPDFCAHVCTRGEVLEVREFEIRE